MSVNNGVINKPVSISDILEVLGTNVSNLSALCLHPNINLKSRYKPKHTNYTKSSIYPISFNTFSALKNAVVNNFEGVDSIFDSATGEGLWRYVTPNVYKMSDFVAYSQTEKRDFITCELKIDSNKYEFDGSFNVSNYNNFSLKLLKNLTNLDYVNSTGYFTILFIGENNEHYVINDENPIYENWNIGYKTLETDLSIISEGIYKVLPCVTDRRFYSDRLLHEITITPSSSLDGLYSYSMLPWYPITLNVTYYDILTNFHEIIRDLRLTYEGYDFETSKYKFTVTNYGNALDFFILKDVIGFTFYHLDGIDFNHSRILYPNSSMTFEITNIEERNTVSFLLYRREFEDNTYSITEDSENYINEYKVCSFSSTLNFVLETESSNITNEDFILKDFLVFGKTANANYPASSWDSIGGIEVSGGLCLLLFPKGRDLSDIKTVSYSNNLIAFDDWAYGVKFLSDWIGGESSSDSFLFQIKLSSLKYNKTWTKDFYRSINETGFPLFSGEYESKIVRVPYSHEDFEFVDYMLYYPEGRTAEVLTRNCNEFEAIPEVLVYEYSENNHNYITRTLDFNDIAYPVIEKISTLEHKWTFYCLPNKTNNYRIISIEGRMHIVFEPYSNSRIYYGTCFLRYEYLENKILLLFSLLSSKVLKEDSFELSCKKEDYICIPENFNYTFTITNSLNVEATNNRELSTFEDLYSTPTNLGSYGIYRNVTWGTQSYLVLKIYLNNIKITFNKK